MQVERTPIQKSVEEPVCAPALSSDHPASEPVDFQVLRIVEAAMAGQVCAVPNSPSQCARMSEWARAGRLVRVFPNMYIVPDVEHRWGQNPRIRAWWLARTYAFRYPKRPLCSFSAAVVQGLWVSYSLMDKLYVVATPGETTHRAPGVFYRKIGDFDVETVDGVAVTSIEQTVLDCVLAAPFAEGLAIADSAIRYRDVTNETLLAYFRKHGKRRPGIKKAMMVARYASGDAENGGESIVRGLIIAAGYMPPSALQLEFRDPVDEAKTVRADGFFALPRNRGVILEVDGMDKYPELRSEDGEGAEGDAEEAVGGVFEQVVEDVRGKSPGSDGPDGLRDALVDERQRESHLTALGYPVMRVLFKRVREKGYLVSLLRAYGIPQIQDPFPFA